MMPPSWRPLKKPLLPGGPTTGLIRQVEVSIRTLGFRIQTLREQIDLFERTLLPQAEQVLLSTEEAYATGRLGVLELLDSERDLFQLRMGLAGLMSDTMKSMAELERAVGVFLPGGEPVKSHGGWILGIFLAFLLGLALPMMIDGKLPDWERLAGWLDRVRFSGSASDLGQQLARLQLWTCGMHPQVIQKESGTCPICHMELVPGEGFRG